MVEDLGGEVGIFEVHGEEGVALVLGGEGVGEIEVGLGIEEGAEAFLEVLAGVAELDHDELAGGEGDAFFEENFFRAVRVVEDEAGDGGIPRVLHAESNDFDFVGGEEVDEGGEGTGPVLEEDGVLADEVPPWLGSDLTHGMGRSLRRLA